MTGFRWVPTWAQNQTFTTPVTIVCLIGVIVLGVFGYNLNTSVKETSRKTDEVVQVIASTCATESYKAEDCQHLMDRLIESSSREQLRKLSQKIKRAEEAKALRGKSAPATPENGSHRIGNTDAVREKRSTPTPASWGEKNVATGSPFPGRSAVRIWR